MDNIEKINLGNVNEADLFEYATSNDFMTALTAVSSPLATSVILDVAALDQDARIRIAALKNKKISDKTLLRLCNDNNSFVAKIAQEEAERRGL